jgi:ubiquinone/menaquinone biosynthesis C-methylase UbiE
MAGRVDLLPIEVDEFLSGIQAQITASKDAVPSQASAIQFFPPVWVDDAVEQVQEVPSEENFCEQDYLLSNPDIADAVRRGDFRSGFDHWSRLGKHEGRSFHPVKFIELEYLDLNPDAVPAIQAGKFASGRDHWERRGRLEGRSTRKPVPLVLSHLKRVGSEMQVRLAQIGEVPANPGTLRGAIGHQVITILHRLLWWQTRSVSAFAEVATRGFKEHIGILEHLVAAQEQNHRTLTSIQQAVNGIGARLEESAHQQQKLTSRIGHLESDVLSVRDLNASLADESRELSIRMNALAEKMNAAEAHQSERARGLHAALAAELAARESLAGRMESTIQEIQGLRSCWSAQQQKAERLSGELAAQQSRITTLLETSGQNPESDHKLDALYLAFEDRFRGPREEIKRRQTVYLPFLKEAQAGTPEAPVLDLGCGRGEWIEMLRDERMTARGLDQNAAMIAQCRALGLDVELGDALAYLRCLPDANLGAITSFHMIEHIPFGSLVALLEESIRVLKPGGILILETPNPKNLMVASHSFYLDPSHLKPLPPEMLCFFVEAAGFANCQVLELQPGPVPPESENLVPKYLNDLLYGPRDYGLVARRP